MESSIMKQFLKKPLGLAVTATLAMGSMAAFTTASALTDADALGDLALVPYYTVRDNFVTGVHIINTSSATKVVKLRLRRGTDSADALDFNLIMSPYDEWTGTINDDGGALGISSADTTCTAPIANGSDSSGKPKFVAPNTFRAGADEGYLEVIGMADADAAQPISAAALHSNGIPANCAAVRGNFLAANVTSPTSTTSSNGVSTYTDSDNALKVSYFVRDAASGMEMGDNATHIKDFADAAMMTNQQYGLNSGDVNGFDFPDLDGGGALAANRGLYDSVIRADLGSAAIINDWSYNSVNGVSTDWVVTIPGQYLMDNPADNGMLVVNGMGDVTNHRDLPVRAVFTVFDREEGKETAGGLVISPSPIAAATDFTQEVNVVEWGGQKVFNTAKPTKITPSFGSTVGWSDLTISSNTAARMIYDLTGVGAAAAPLNGIPVIGFTAWQRTFADASKNYGRIVGHSRTDDIISAR